MNTIRIEKMLIDIFSEHFFFLQIILSKSKSRRLLSNAYLLTMLILHIMYVPNHQKI